MTNTRDKRSGADTKTRPVHRRRGRAV